MKQNNFWLRAMNVRPDEGWLVKNLFLLQFLQGVGIAFFFTASFALFLDRFEITELPYVFIYSSFLLWITGFVYGRLEHKLKISQLAIVITVFMAASILWFRLSYAFAESPQFLYFMLAWFSVLYLLNNLEFWGIASLLFDVRQSKRLFGVISAGDIPAKVIGYSLALLTVEYIGTINLLWAGAACMLASIPFLVSIERSGKLKQAHHKHTTHSHLKHHSPAVGKLVKNFSGNILIRRLAILSIIISGSFIIINYGFYAGVKAAYHDDVSLAKFIAFFLAFVRIIALVVKIIFTGRLINRLGIIKSLLITPIVMLLLLSSILLTQNMDGYQKIIIYIYGATSIVVDILRSAIDTPVFLTMMQPLSTHERLRAHTIVKGIMDPFASLLAGGLLLLLIHYEHEANLLTIGYVLLVISIFWIIGIYRVNNQYLHTIVKTISSRYFNKENFTINDSGTLDWLKEKIKNGSETEVSNIVNMLYSSSNKISDELALLALQHTSEKVKMQALRLIQQKGNASTTEYLLPILHSSVNAMIIAETIKALCKTGVDNGLILPYLESKEEKVRQAALSGLLNYGTGESKKAVERKLQDMLVSVIANEKIIAARVLSEQEKFSHMEMIQPLMKDENISVRKAAFFAVGRSGNEQLLMEMIKRIAIDENEIMEPLFIAGEHSLPVILSCITEDNITKRQKEKLVFLCGRIGGEKAHTLLFTLLNSQPEEYRAVIKAMYRSNYLLRPKQQPVFIEMAKKLLEQSAGIVYMESSLQRYGEKYQLLINSFQLELVGLRESLLYVFALLYDRENINKVRTAYSTGKKESIINAMEIIDITVRNDLAGQFNTIFEPGDIAERMHGLRNIFPAEFFETVELLLSRILAEDKHAYHYWTLACSLYTSKKQHHDIDKYLIRKYTAAENLLLRETAVFAL